MLHFLSLLFQKLQLHDDDVCIPADLCFYANQQDHAVGCLPGPPAHLYLRVTPDCELDSVHSSSQAALFSWRLLFRIF